MSKIEKHPILDIPVREKCSFLFNGKEVECESGYTIAAALHNAGYPVHSHSLSGRKRSLACGIGKCGACEMVVDGEVKRICITKVDGVKQVEEISEEWKVGEEHKPHVEHFKCDVVIIGAGPAGLSVRETLLEKGVNCVIVDNNDTIGGQFNMQTHQFFFFEEKHRFGGMRGFDIARNLAGDNHEGIFTGCTVWDVMEGGRVAVKRIATGDIFYIQTDYLIVATGAVPFTPMFQNDDLPGVYTAAVVQKMMNTEHTLLGKSVLTVGAGNIGYLTSYQLIQAGAKVKAIIEAMPREGGFPVQANRLRRLAVPILTGKTLIRAIPREDGNGICGAVIADCQDFKPIPGTEQVIDGIDVINVCTGLIPDNQLVMKGKAIFGERCLAAGDSVRIGEGTSAVLRGKEVAYEIFNQMNIRVDYEEYIEVSKKYLDSQQRPKRVKEFATLPSEERAAQKPFVVADCLYGFACNPCTFACPHSAITKRDTKSVPEIDYTKCVGCMECVTHCPGLAIFGYDKQRSTLFLPVEYEVEKGAAVWLVDNNGKKLGEGTIAGVIAKPNKTNLCRVKCEELYEGVLTDVRGFIVKENYPNPIEWKSAEECGNSSAYVCHCEDIPLEQVLEIVGDRKYISIDEVKHTVRVGMGPCRGKRCIPRLRTALRACGVELTGESTPRAPLSNQVLLSEVSGKSDMLTEIIGFKKTERREVDVLIAGGGMGGSSLFRYFAEAGRKPVMLNYGQGSTWRCIAGGRPAFSLPALAEIGAQNRVLFEELQNIRNIDYKPIQYVGFAHDEESYKALEASMAWSKAEMITPDKFRERISPYFSKSNSSYIAALLTDECWQATPGKCVGLLRDIAIAKGGEFLDDCKVLDAKRDGNKTVVLTKLHNGQYVEFVADHFVNAMGYGAGEIADKMGINTGMYPVRHQALITSRLPMLGVDGDNLNMLIDRRRIGDFSAVYGQQLKHTGQFIACASPAHDSTRIGKELKLNTEEFLQVTCNMLKEWIPELAGVDIQAIWSGYYVEPRYFIDPDLGLFAGLQGHGFMFAQYLAKLYVDYLSGRQVPDFFKELKMDGNGLAEHSFK